MGWTGMNKPYNVSRWLKEKLTWDAGGRKNTCLDVAIVQRKTAYAAVQTVYPDGITETWAAVYELHFYPRSKEGETFTYKDMSEHMGPYQVDCPKRILARLTPTDDKNANDWRAKCRARLERREANKIADGDYIRLAHKLRFEGHGERDTFKYVPFGNKPRFMAISDDGYEIFLCRISNWRDREFVKLEEDAIPRPPEPRM